MVHDTYYVKKAEEMRALAQAARKATTREEFLKLAIEYKELAEKAGETGTLPGRARKPA